MKREHSPKSSATKKTNQQRVPLSPLKSGPNLWNTDVFCPVDTKSVAALNKVWMESGADFECELKYTSSPAKPKRLKLDPDFTESSKSDLDSSDQESNSLDQEFENIDPISLAELEEISETGLKL